MKTSLAVLALALTFTTNVFAENSANLNLKAQEIITLKKLDNNRFGKISAQVKGDMTLTITINGNTRTATQDLSESNGSSDLLIEVTGKNIVRLIDSKAGIDQEVQADINKSLLGRVKTISIDSKTMEALYSDSLKKSGLEELQGIRFIGNSGAISSKITTSAMECESEKDLLICTQSQELDLTITKK
jgi:hypothetical protein